MAKRTGKAKLGLIKFPEKPAEDPWLRATPLEYLEDLVAQVKAGAEMRGILIFYLDANSKPNVWRRGVGISEQIAFGQLISEMALKEWREG